MRLVCVRVSACVCECHCGHVGVWGCMPAHVRAVASGGASAHILPTYMHARTHTSYRLTASLTEASTMANLIVNGMKGVEGRLAKVARVVVPLISVEKGNRIQVFV